MYPFRVILLDIKEPKIASLKTLPSEVNKSEIVGDVVLLRLSDNGTFCLLPYYQSLDFQGVKIRPRSAVDENEISSAVSTISG
jgi:hypothetical protein